MGFGRDYLLTGNKGCFWDKYVGTCGNKTIKGNFGGRILENSK